MSQASTLERQMLDLINQERTSRGFNPLQLELRLNDSAEDHSEWMLQQDVFSHTGTGGSSPGDRMRDADFQFSGSWAWAENIAWQSERGAPGLADDVVNLHNSLMNSDGHRANILNPNVTLIGIGIEQGNYRGWDAVMVTQNFAKTSAPLQLDNGSGGNQPDPDDPAPLPPSTTATTGADILSLSTPGLLKGLAGADTLSGSAGDDKLVGGSGNDQVLGGRGDDIVTGGSGKDDLTGGRGDDTINGGSGSDTIDGQAGNDLLKGRKGSDVFIFSTGNDVVQDFDEFDGAEDIVLSQAVGINNYFDLRSNHMSQEGSHVLIEDDQGNSLLIKNALMADLDSSDFLF